MAWNRRKERKVELKRRLRSIACFNLLERLDIVWPALPESVPERMKTDLDAIGIARGHEPLIGWKWANCCGLQKWFDRGDLRLIKRHIVVSDARDRLELVLGLEIEELHPRVYFSYPKSIAIICDQAGGYRGIGWTLDYSTDVNFYI